MTGSRRVLVCALLAISTARPSTAAAEFVSFEPLRGYLDVGLAVDDALRNGLEGGYGKLRYGDDGSGTDFQPVLSEARVIAALNFGPAWRALVDVKYDDAQHHLLDIGEAFLTYRSAPLEHGLRWRLKVGTFLPPFSLENRAIGWTSPYTLSSSALNAWVGEELRVNGGELRLMLDRNDWQYSLAASSYLANDAAGTMIAYRGWAIHDRELGLFDRMRVPREQISLFEQLGRYRAQSPYYEPLHEIDGRPGYYAGLTVRDPGARRLEVYYYNNDGDPEALNRTAGQWAWRTRFWVAGFETPLPWDLLFVTQAMVGDTAMGRHRGGVQPRGMQMDYFTGYGLLVRSFSNIQVSVRGEYFEVRDKDFQRGGLDNGEAGYGVTVAASRALSARTKLTLETQYVEHDRPVRAWSGEPVEADEWLLRLSVRLFL